MFNTKYGVSRSVVACMFVVFSVESACANGNTADDGTAFDWFANAATAPTDPALQAQLIRLAAAQTDGSGSWVCSPAGFGKPSTCFNR